MDADTRRMSEGMTDIKDMYKMFDNDESGMPISILSGACVMGAIHYIGDGGLISSKVICIPATAKRVILSVPEGIKVEAKE